MKKKTLPGNTTPSLGGGWGEALRTAAYRYCNYQERCHQEVRNKLYELGAKTPEVEELLAELIEKDLLNEERFARSFARGRFRIKHWGKNKIIAELRQRRISDYCIRKALTEIDPEEYWEVLGRLVRKKWEEYSAQKPEWTRRIKVQRYLLQRGFEASLIDDAVKEMINAAG